MLQALRCQRRHILALLEQNAGGVLHDLGVDHQGIERDQRLGAAIAGLRGSADTGLSTDEIMALTRE